jgi:hypothetical protein
VGAEYCDGMLALQLPPQRHPIPDVLQAFKSDAKSTNFSISGEADSCDGFLKLASGSDCIF